MWNLLKIQYSVQTLIIITLLSNIVRLCKTITIRHMKAAWLRCWPEHWLIPDKYNHLILPQKETESFVVQLSTSRTEAWLQTSKPCVFILRFLHWETSVLFPQLKTAALWCSVSPQKDAEEKRDKIRSISASLCWPPADFKTPSTWVCFLDERFSSTNVCMHFYLHVKKRKPGKTLYELNLKSYDTIMY